MRAYADGAALTAHQAAGLRLELAHAHVRAIQACWLETIDTIVVHGQTVFHQPPLTWQMIDAPAVAVGCGARVMADLRSADARVVGRAPITPLADRVLFGGQDLPVAVVNLGGFINVTELAPVTSAASAVPNTSETLHDPMAGFTGMTCVRVISG